MIITDVTVILCGFIIHAVFAIFIVLAQIQNLNLHTDDALNVT